MPRIIDRLSARGVLAISAPGLHADGGGLYLRVDPSGAKRWAFLFQWRGHRKEMSLGSLADVSLAQARTAARDARLLVKGGSSPIEERQRQRAALSPVTFGEVADDLIAQLSPGWKSPVHKQQWEMTLKEYAAPLRPLLPAQIGTEDVLAVLRPIWQEKPETASRVRGRIERVLDAAKVRKLRDGDNPARWRGHLALLLSKPRKLSRGHHPALPYDDLPGFMSALRQRDGVSAQALEFTILTIARTDATRGAHISEIDVTKAVWTVPKERLKRSCDHRVPLSTRALEIAKARIAAAGTDGFLFPAGPISRHPQIASIGKKRKPVISNMAMANLLPHLGRPNITVHGFRSTFKDWACDCTLFPNELSEIALHHAVGDETEQAYRRGDGLKLRIQMMEAWERFCSGESNVVTLPVISAAR